MGHKGSVKVAGATFVPYVFSKTKKCRSASRRGMLVMPVRRGVPVTPADVGWIIKWYFADTTSVSFRFLFP